VTLDLSSSGVGFLSPRPLKVGEALDLEFITPSGSRPLRLMVEVVWCSEVAGRRLNHRCGARLRAISVRDSLVLKRQLQPERELRAAGYSLLWLPSQWGGLPVCLHRQSATFFFWATSNCRGVREVALCDPSQNGWPLDRPHAHHQ